MERNTIIIALLTLIVGLLIGYFLSANTMPNRGMIDAMNEMHNENDRHWHGNDILSDEDIIRQDGAMQHAMEEIMLGFRGKTGAAYEEIFLKQMIVHHLGAIEMAEGLLQETERPELTGMAHDIIKVQSEEVDMMKNWMHEWFNEN